MLTDIYLPADHQPLSNYDNYRIYSVVICKTKQSTGEYYVGNSWREVYSTADYAEISQADFNAWVAANPPTRGGAPPGRSEAFFTYRSIIGGGSFDLWVLFSGYTLVSRVQTVFAGINTYNTPGKTLDLYAIQTYDPSGTVDVLTIENLISKYPKKTAGGFIASCSRSLADSNTSESFKIEYFPEINQFDWRKLWVDGTVTFSGVSDFTGIFTYAYWARNPLEAHPQIAFTADYRKQSIFVTQGQKFTIQLNHPIAETLVLSRLQLAVLLDIMSANVIGNKPLNITEYLVSSNIYGARIKAQHPDVMPPPAPEYPPPGNTATGTTWVKRGITSVYVNNGFSLQRTGGSVTYGEFANGLEIISNEIEYQLVPADNNIWQHPLPMWNFPEASVSLPDLSNAYYYQLHYQPQPDGSFGTIEMNSPQILEIWYALEAGRFAQPDANGNPPAVTLAHHIERQSHLMGYRPEPDGMIDDAKELKFKRQPIKADASFNAQEYRAGQFGSKGMVVRRLPNKKSSGGWEPGGYVKIHDMPQLINEVFDQANTALNIQDSTSIEIVDGGSTYEYPNQLALLMEIATGTIQFRRQVREIWTSSIVTQNTINEIIAGIGLPTVNKSLTLNGQIIPYWGIQPDKSLQREIATVGYNVGVVMGQVL